jgi:hypothetical protein
MDAHRPRIARPHLAILAALILASAVSLIAAAAHGAVQSAKPKSTAVSPLELTSVKGKCPKGTTAVSGGFSSPDFFTLDSLVVRTASVRAGRRGWKVTGAGLGAGEGRMLAHAYCDTGNLSIRVRKGKVSVPEGEIRLAKASCRKGETVLSGGFVVPGFSADGGPQVAVVSSLRKGRRTWVVQGSQPDDTPGGPYGPAKMLAYAYCSSDAPQISVRRKTVQVTPSDDFGAVLQTRCRKGTRAIAGGFRGHLDIQSDGTALGSTAISSTRLGKGRGWRTEVFAVAESASVPLTGLAYCA